MIRARRIRSPSTRSWVTISRSRSCGTTSTSPGSRTTAGHEHRLAGDQAELAEEPPRAVNADHSLAGARLLDHRHLPLEDHEEVAVPVALAVEHVPGLDASALADRLERRDLLIAQPRERAVDVGRLGQRQRLRRRH